MNSITSYKTKIKTEGWSDIIERSICRTGLVKIMSQNLRLAPCIPNKVIVINTLTYRRKRKGYIFLKCYSHDGYCPPRETNHLHNWLNDNEEIPTDSVDRGSYRTSILDFV